MEIRKRVSLGRFYKVREPATILASIFINKLNSGFPFEGRKMNQKRENPIQKTQNREEGEAEKNQGNSQIEREREMMKLFFEVRSDKIRILNKMINGVLVVIIIAAQESKPEMRVPERRKKIPGERDEMS